MISRRDLILGFSAGSAALLLPQTALASTARAVSVTELVHSSTHVLVGHGEEAHSKWETNNGARRIVTYSRVRVMQPVDGRPPESQEIYVRTLGGRVGDLGQIVHGEARIELGRAGLLFLSPDLDGILNVTAMAQGHYLIRPDSEGVQRLKPSPDVASLLQAVKAAVQQFPGRTIPEAEQIVERELRAK